MGRYAIDDDQRRRLAEAQRAEVAALQSVTNAHRRRQKLQARIDAADEELGSAHQALVEVSGFQRAVLLTGESPGELRRLLRSAAAVPDVAAGVDATSAGAPLNGEG